MSLPLIDEIERVCGAIRGHAIVKFENKMLDRKQFLVLFQMEMNDLLNKGIEQEIAREVKDYDAFNAVCG